MVDFAMLAKEAVPQNFEDRGSRRQSRAAVAFFEAVEEAVSAETFAAMKAACRFEGTERRVAEAMRVLQMQGKA